MLVYRLESVKDHHRGAYRAYSIGVQGSVGSFLTMSKYGQTHPCPKIDPLLKDKWFDVENKSAYYFAFETVESFFEWFFRVDRYEKVEDTVHVKVYDVPDSDVLVGEKQVAFRIAVANPLEEYSLSNFLEQNKDRIGENEYASL